MRKLHLPDVIRSAEDRVAIYKGRDINYAAPEVIAGLLRSKQVRGAIAALVDEINKAIDDE